MIDSVLERAYPPLRGKGRRDHVTGWALEEPHLFTILRLEREMDSHVGDVRDPEAFRRVIRTTEPEYLFHFATQALLADGYEDLVSAFDLGPILDPMNDPRYYNIKTMQALDCNEAGKRRCPDGIMRVA